MMPFRLPEEPIVGAAGVYALFKPWVQSLAEEEAKSKAPKGSEKAT
jgi:hypothetical protein